MCSVFLSGGQPCSDVSVCVYVQLWELSSGEMLLSVLFDVEIMSVTLDPCDYYLFCGGSDGNIFQVSLCNQVSLSVTILPTLIHPTYTIEQSTVLSH